MKKLKTNQTVGKLVLEKDWSQHALGPLDTWPSVLLNTLRTILNSQTPMFVFWGDEALCFYNDGYLPILGNEKHPQSLGAKARQVWPEIWSAIIEHRLKDVFETGASTWQTDQLVPLNRNGALVKGFFTNGFSPIYNDDGEICGVLVIAIETTATTDALIQSESKFKQIAESLPQLVWSCRPDGNCDYLSKQWEDYTGMKQGEQLGLDWLSKVIHPDDRARTLEHWMGAVNGLHPYDIEYRIRRHDGVYRWFKTRGTDIRNSLGEISHWFGTCTDIEDTKLAQLQFEKNVDTSPAMLWITDANGVCTYLSEQWYEMTGQTAETGLGYGWLDATHPDDKEKAGNVFLKANQNQTYFKNEYRLKNKKGEYRWAIDAGNPRFDKNGVYVGMAGTVFDVHERKLAEERAEDAKNRILSIVDHAPIVLWALDKEGTYTLSQGLGLAGVGYQSDELIGRNHFELYKNNPSFCKSAERALAGEVFVSEDKVKERIFRTSYSPIKDKTGSIIGMSGVSVDMTDSKKAEAEILTERENLRNLFKQTPEMVCILRGPEHFFEFVNEAHIKVLGFNAQGKSVREAQPESIEVHGILDRVYQTGQTNVINKAPITVGSKIRYFDLTFSARKDRFGHINGIMLLGTEVTDQVESRLRIEELASNLQEAVRARDEFLSIASHELKTPLTSLKLQAQLHTRAVHKQDPKAYAPEKVDHLVSQTEMQIARLTRLVDDMLDVSRIQSGKFNIEREEFNLCDLVDNVTERFKEQFFNSSYTLPKVNYDPGAVGRWDRMRIEQVVMNLITNAIRYGNQNPISFAIQSDSTSVSFSIEDHGLGIEASAKEKIFERFERAVTANEVSGLGLGLFITRQIVNAHGGNISVESKIGVGSTFTVVLPKS